MGLDSVQADAEILKKAQLVTAFTSQELKSWLKATARKNILPIIVTLLTSQEPMSWLKEVVSLNIALMFVTLLTSQESNVLVERGSRNN